MGDGHRDDRIRKRSMNSGPRREGVHDQPRPETSKESTTMCKFVLVIAAFTSLFAASAHAQTKLEIASFPTGGTWPIYVGLAQGYFSTEKLDVHLTTIESSTAQIKGMMDGTYDLALTALDNVIAYDAGQGATKLDQNPDLFAFMGGEGGSLRLITAPDVKKVEDLKDRTLAVDAKNTGFAFVLYDIAARHGLKAKDYKLLAVGNSQKRLDALTGGQAQAALLNRPFDAFAEAKGFNNLVSMQDVFPHYQSSVGMARRAWASKHRDALVAFVRAYLTASKWLFDPANKAAAIDILMKNTKGVSAKQAEDIYASTTGAGSVVSPTAALDPEGVATVVRLRSAYGEPKRDLQASDFFDLGYYAAATK
jgi:ABC-type nitrate/sulfonate/bicarbonate transport system substrate-binding protein